MKLEEAKAWLKGERSMCNMIPQNPLETYHERVARTDAHCTKQAYLIVKAHAEGLVPSEAAEKSLCRTCGGEGTISHIDHEIECPDCDGMGDEPITHGKIPRPQRKSKTPNVCDDCASGPDCDDSGCEYRDE